MRQSRFLKFMAMRRGTFGRQLALRTRIGVQDGSERRFSAQDDF